MKNTVDSSAATHVTHGIRKKRVGVDQKKLDRAVAILGARSEAEAIDRALDLVIFRHEVIGGIERLAGTGGVENYFEEQPTWRDTRST
ncbi:MAG TPA: hypothetical protein VF606_07250 [Geminicoccaceae bacterium]|jgi:hypothetical protein